MVYNIPGVYTSLIDRSYIQPIPVAGRSVLVAGFSKFGDDRFYHFADADEMEFAIGANDIKKYGRGLFYCSGALSKTQNVIFKRLMPDDATYANLLFKTTNEVETRNNVINTDNLKTFIDNDSGVEFRSIEAKEVETVASDNQSGLYWDYNPNFLLVFISGIQIKKSEYIAVNGHQILFNTPLTQGSIINVYTIFDYTNPSTVAFVDYEHTVLAMENGNSTFSVPAYDPQDIRVSLNGLEIPSTEYTATNGSSITFLVSGGLNTDDFFVLNGVIDNSGLLNDYFTQENIIVLPSGQTQNTISYLNGYNPSLTMLSVNGVMLGGSEYVAVDGYNIIFGAPLQNDDVVILHSAKPGINDHYYGTMFAKGRGDGYNDIYIQFRSAYDFEKSFADEEGDIKYKFNFLKAIILEETPSGFRTISDEFVVSLIDTDPLTGAKIINPINGEDLYINNKFKNSNTFVEYYGNENYLPLFYEDLSINDLTENAAGEAGGNRFILIDYDINGRKRNVEYFIDDVYEDASTVNGKNIKIRSTSIIGKGPDIDDPTIQGLYMNYYNPYTGFNEPKQIVSRSGQYFIQNPTGTGSEYLDYIYLDGTQSFYKATIILNPLYVVGGTEPQYIFNIVKHESARRDLYNMLNGTTKNIVWNLKGGYSGSRLHVAGRLNMGEVPGSLVAQDAKQLLIDFYKNNEEIHEVLYPELDFDYIPEWTGDIDVSAAIIQLADEIGFTMPLLSEPRSTSTEQDYNARLEDLYLSSYNSMIYSGQWNDNQYDEKSGGRMTTPTSYYAMINHLNVDNSISITEPVANIVKGQMPVAGYKLTHVTKSRDIEKLRKVQINTIIKETDGIYFIDQLTAYKSASKLSRANVMKPIHRMRKDLPRLLKDLLQKKANSASIGQAKSRTEKYMSRWVVRDDNLTDGIFSNVIITPVFYTDELKLVISIAVTPIGTIEKIEIPITVY